MKVVSAPGDVPDALLGDTLTEGLNRILASVFNGDPTPLQSLIEDPGVDDYVRWAAIDAFPVLVEAGEMKREAVVAYFERLFTGGLERKPDVVWDGLVGAVADLRAPEPLDHARRAYSENLAVRSIADLQSTEHEVLHGTSRRSRHGTLITDTIAELQGWACFDERRLRRAAKLAARPKPRLVSSGTSAAKPVKVGRNDPCPCGSGKKYKKCCVNN